MCNTRANHHSISLSDITLLSPQVAATAKRLHAETSWNPTACGYAFDASSGYYYCAASGLYYDPPSAGFFNHASNLWYTYDAATSEYVEMVQKS